MCCPGLTDEQTSLAGETLVLRWTVEPHQPGADPTPADLNVTLTGPFGSLSDAKQYAWRSRPPNGRREVESDGRGKNGARQR